MEASEKLRRRTAGHPAERGAFHPGPGKVTFKLGVKDGWEVEGWSDH